jgi:hypothetical protein
LLIGLLGGTDAEIDCTACFLVGFGRSCHGPAFFLRGLPPSLVLARCFSLGFTGSLATLFPGLLAKLQAEIPWHGDTPYRMPLGFAMLPCAMRLS